MAVTFAFALVFHWGFLEATGAVTPGVSFPNDLLLDEATAAV